MADAYKILGDVTLPKAIRLVDELIDGTPMYEQEGILYEEGSYVLAKDIAPDVRERAENGEMDHILEEVSLDEANEYLNMLNGVPRGIFVPEHEVEAEALLDAGHKIVDREEKLKLRSAGADFAKEAQEEALADGADERAVTIESTPSTVAASSDEEVIVPRRIGAEDQYVTAEEAGQVQTDPSGVVAQMPSGDEDKPKRRAPRRAPAPKQESSTSSEGDK